MSQRLAHAVADGRRLFERHTLGHVRQQAGFAHADILGMRAVPEAEDAVSHVELRDRDTDRLDHAGELEAQDPPLGSQQAEHETPDERARLAHVTVRPRDRGGVDAHEHLVVLRDRPLDVLESQNGRRPIPVVDNCSHAFTSSPRFTESDEPAPFTVRTTFPVFCPVSTYFVASTTSSSG